MRSKYEYPFFSVIVPIYKVDKYIAQCIDSIIGQDFQKFELILVDDGSPDECGEICNIYAKDDERIKVIHKANGGLSDARNAGLMLASGNYIWFVDGDDFLLSNHAFTYIYDEIKESDADVIFFSYKKFFEETAQYSKGLYDRLQNHLGIEESIKKNAYKALGCNKVVKRSIITRNQMSFPVGVLGEDLGWCADLLIYSDKIVMIKESLLAYRQRAGSITHNKEQKSRCKHLKNTIFMIEKTLSKHNLDVHGTNKKSLVLNYLAYEYAWLLGESFPFWKELAAYIKRLSFLLDFDMGDKVKKVKVLKKIIGLKGAAMVLNLYIRFKNNFVLKQEKVVK